MNAVELALEKQRLQFAIAFQREAMTRYGTGLAPLFAAADHVVAASRWVKHHPEAVAGGIAILVAAQPRRWRLLWRWTRRGFFAWRLWHDSERWLGPRAKYR